MFCLLSSSSWHNFAIHSNVVRFRVTCHNAARELVHLKLINVFPTVYRSLSFRFILYNFRCFWPVLRKFSGKVKVAHEALRRAMTRQNYMKHRMLNLFYSNTELKIRLTCLSDQHGSLLKMEDNSKGIKSWISLVFKLNFVFQSTILKTQSLIYRLNFSLYPTTASFLLFDNGEL